jgi:hypothetical protein
VSEPNRQNLENDGNLVKCKAPPRTNKDPFEDLNNLNQGSTTNRHKEALIRPIINPSYERTKFVNTKIPYPIHSIALSSSTEQF